MSRKRGPRLETGGQKNNRAAGVPHASVADTPAPGTKATRQTVEALLSTLDPDAPLPAWARMPQTEAQFCASILVHCPDVTPGYDANDKLVWLYGIGLREPGDVS